MRKSTLDEIIEELRSDDTFSVKSGYSKPEITSISGYYIGKKYRSKSCTVEVLRITGYGLLKLRDIETGEEFEAEPNDLDAEGFEKVED